MLKGACITHLQAERPEGRESGVYLSELAKIRSSEETTDLHAFLQGDGGEVTREFFAGALRKAETLEDLGFASLTNRMSIRRENVCDSGERRATGKHVVAAGLASGYFNASCTLHYITPKRATFLVSTRRILAVPQWQWVEYHRVFSDHVNRPGRGDKGENDEGLEHVWALLFDCCWGREPQLLTKQLAEPWVRSHFPITDNSKVISAGQVVPDVIAGNFACYDRPGVRLGGTFVGLPARAPVADAHARAFSDFLKQWHHHRSPPRPA